MQVSGGMVLFLRMFGAQALKIILKIAIYAVSDAKAFCAIIQKIIDHCGQLSMKDIKDICVVVQARLGSERVPAKMLKDFAGTTLMDIMCQKILNSKSIPKENFFLSIHEQELLDNAEKYDLNGDYNTSNYTFTAPIAGRYLIQCHVSFNAGEITTNTRNNVGYAVGGSVAYRQFGSSTGSNDRYSMGFSVVQELAASNAVTFIVHLESDDCDLWMESSPEKYSWASVTLLC